MTSRAQRARPCGRKRSAGLAKSNAARPLWAGSVPRDSGIQRNRAYLTWARWSRSVGAPMRALWWAPTRTPALQAPALVKRAGNPRAVGAATVHKGSRASEVDLRGATRYAHRSRPLRVESLGPAHSARGCRGRTGSVLAFGGEPVSTAHATHYPAQRPPSATRLAFRCNAGAPCASRCTAPGARVAPSSGVATVCVCPFRAHRSRESRLSGFLGPTRGARPCCGSGVYVA